MRFPALSGLIDSRLYPNLSERINSTQMNPARWAATKATDVSDFFLSSSWRTWRAWREIILAGRRRLGSPSLLTTVQVRERLFLTQSHGRGKDHSHHFQ